ncbi:MAG TPA: hypothetical protein VEQ59_02615 [Polyangiaceae bacterium]|nr:hypothetical protein [Polyangiaceae bacterium]
MPVHRPRPADVEIGRHPPHLHELIDETVLRTAYRFSRQNQLKTARLLGISRNVVRARV